MEKQCQQIQEYKEELWVSKREIDKQLKDGQAKMQKIVDSSILRMDDLMQHVNAVKQRQDLLSEQFRQFGEGIEMNSHRLDQVDATLKYFRHHHADKFLMEARLAQVDQAIGKFNNMVEAVRLDLQATDKFIQLY